VAVIGRVDRELVKLFLIPLRSWLRKTNRACFLRGSFVFAPIARQKMLSRFLSGRHGAAIILTSGFGRCGGYAAFDFKNLSIGFCGGSLHGCCFPAGTGNVF
jgi:hypothetical protein